MQSNSQVCQSLLVPAAVAATLAGVSRATWWRLHAAAKLPAVTKLGHRSLWNRDELVAWIEAKCPDRRTWEAMQSQHRRGRCSAS